ncbi:MAG: serine/threonine-protein phosphatase, partial [Firmicutes bacterium]|nr:serine/threonine-protein phosphatase [Bacillota bacterium]
ELSGMGTTLTVIWEDGDRVLLGHVGDSRAYRLRGEQLTQVSQDHSLVAEMVRDGLLTQEEADRHPYRNIITRALGTDEEVEPDILELDKQPGDRFLICSDGLTEYVKDQQLLEILTAQGMEQAADTLLGLALSGGGRDNISLVLAEVCA